MAQERKWIASNKDFIANSQIKVAFQAQDSHRISVTELNNRDRMSVSGDDLLDGLDDLPSMMTQLASPGRSGGSNKFSTSSNSAKASEARASRFQGKN